ncbi:coenzyme Q-binding protein COQ10 homolog B, mitochondrial-like [Ambystoma mexicanum]|uniref:coenzyme Q-binding protein COQ10 homolog B, mitochondrial-like n=1 Tax=Ambystoma mexicanum TaxID=8296 RepID=UPI0037E93286
MPVLGARPHCDVRPADRLPCKAAALTGRHFFGTAGRGHCSRLSTSARIRHAMAGSASTRKAASALLRALVETESGALRRTGAQGRRHGMRHLSSCGILASQSTMTPSLLSASLPSKQHTRSFLNLAAPFLGSKRIEYAEAKVLGYSIEQMFDIVANVENYKLFVPWCNSSKILSCCKGVTKAELVVGFPPIIERYTSEISVIPQYQVRAVCNDGKLFSHMETVWRFRPGCPGHPETCTLDFHVSFEFKSLLHSQLANVFFDEVVKKMVSAFEKQAAKIYGPHVAAVPRQLRAAQCS